MKIECIWYQLALKVTHCELSENAFIGVTHAEYLPSESVLCKRLDSIQNKLKKKQFTHSGQWQPILTKMV